MRNEFYRDTQGALLVYDCANKQSFDNLEKWLDEMKNEIGHPREMENVVFCVCANKVLYNSFTFYESHGANSHAYHGCHKDFARGSNCVICVERLNACLKVIQQINNAAMAKHKTSDVW